MIRPACVTRTALAFASTALLLLPALATAQRSHPRSGYVRDPEPVPQTIPYPGASVRFEVVPPRHAPMPRYAAGENSRSPVVIYAVSLYGGGYPMGAYGAPGIGAGGVYDVNGRSLSVGGERGPGSDAVPSYTPDLSGQPYVVIEQGVMLAEMPNGERRSFHACAEATVGRDPAGRPRTVFFGGADEGIVLREGQRGRVHGQPASGQAACYTLDSLGRVTLDY
jgi:hypothetical protein